MDNIFSSLAHATRRDILKRVAKKEHSISEIASRYKLTFAAISKHLKVLEKAKLIIKTRRGKEQLVHISPLAFKDATHYLEFYRQSWEQRFNNLNTYLLTIKK